MWLTKERLISQESGQFGADGNISIEKKMSQYAVLNFKLQYI